MRFLEILLTVLVVFIPIYTFLKEYKNKRIVLFVIMAIFILAHLVFEGYRWQMVPIYFLGLVVLWSVYKGYRFFKRGKLRIAMSVLGFLVLLFTGCAASTVFPVFELPKPTGKYSIGSQYLHITTDRDEVITKDKNDKREFMLKIWYPSKASDKKNETYLTKGDRFGFALKYGMPTSTFNYLDYIKTNTHEDVEVADGAFPVLIFSHGYQSKAFGYYSIIEEIVSQGYIVLNINHTYESTGSLFPNGEVKYYNHEYNNERLDEDMHKMAMDCQEGYFKATNWDEQHKAVEFALRNYQAAFVTQMWAQDITSVIDVLPDWNINTFLKGHLDLSRIGVFGHSQGGAAAGQVLLDDNRVKAAVNVDGVQWGNMIDNIMSKPFALLVSDWPETHPNLNQHVYHNGSKTDFFNAKILKSGHSSFMDIPYMINLKSLSLAGEINPYRASKITNTLLLDFFDKYLKNESKDLLTLSKKYEELEISLHKKSNSKI